MASRAVPISTGCAEYRTKVSSDHSAQPGGRQLRPPPTDSSRRAISSEERKGAATIPRGPASVGGGGGGAPPLAAAQLVAVVGDQDQVGRDVLAAVGAGEAQVEGDGARAEHLGEQPQGGADLAVAV